MLNLRKNALCLAKRKALAIHALKSSFTSSLAWLFFPTGHLMVQADIPRWTACPSKADALRVFILWFYDIFEPAGLRRKKRGNKLLIAKSWYLLFTRAVCTHYGMFTRLPVLIGLPVNTEKTLEKYDCRRYNLIRKFATLRR